MSFAELVSTLTPIEMNALRRLADDASWRTIPARPYTTADVTDYWEPCKRAFFILMPPHSSIHRHSDEAIKGVTHHLVLQTNNQCLNWWLENGEEQSIHLEVGKRYDVQRDPIHWATNDGETERIHLLVEYG